MYVRDPKENHHWLIGSAALLVAAAAWPAGTVIEGMNASTPCQACHGADGVGISDDVPNLAGQKVAYLKAQLSADDVSD